MRRGASYCMYESEIAEEFSCGAAHTCSVPLHPNLKYRHLIPRICGVCSVYNIIYIIIIIIARKYKMFPLQRLMTIVSMRVARAFRLRRRQITFLTRKMDGQSSTELQQGKPIFTHGLVRIHIYTSAQHFFLFRSRREYLSVMVSNLDWFVSHCTTGGHAKGQKSGFASPPLPHGTVNGYYFSRHVAATTCPGVYIT